MPGPSTALVVLFTLAAACELPADAAPSGTVYTVSQRRSAVRVHVGKSGLLSVAGHRHEVIAPVRGSISANAGDLAASSVELIFPTAEFQVLPEDEPAGDAPKVEQVMRGPRVLDATRFAEVRFRSRSVSGRATAASSGRTAYQLQVAGELSIHGVTRQITLPMTVTLDGGTLTSNGRATILQDQFGLTPVTAAGGTVRVRNEIEIDFEIIAERQR